MKSHPIFMNRRIPLVIVTAVILLLAACGSSDQAQVGGDTTETDATATDETTETEADDTEEGELTSVRWGTATTNVSMGQAYYASIPKALGFWEDEGLDVQLNTFDGSVPIIQALDSGALDVGGVGTNSLFSAVGEGVEVIGFYATVTDSFLWPVVLPESGIEGLSDLQGKTIGVTSLESATADAARQWIALAGGNPDEADLAAVGSGADAVAALDNERVDALAFYDGAIAQVEQTLDRKLRVLNDDPALQDIGYQAAAITTKDTLKENRSMIVGIGRGIAKASMFATLNTECAVRAHWEVYPESKPTGVPEDEAIAQGVSVFESRASQLTPDSDEDLWGFNSESEVEAALNAAGITMDIAAVTPDDVADFGLIEEINDFDRDEIRALAEECPFD